VEGWRVIAGTEAQRGDILGLVASLLERLRDPEIAELEVRRDGVRVRVAKHAVPAQTSSVAAPAEPALEAGRSEAAQRAATAKQKASEIGAPLTGVFYRSPSPQAGPFVHVGSTVAAGDIVGLIEAMKLFNEVRSPISGRVRRVVAENGQLVRAHQPLFELE
jgi:acetyl-CoA carboxylase biotin carboxyl carrier protein